MCDTDALHKKMVRLVLPIAFQQFMLALVGASDAVMLGKLNQDSMAAVSQASQVTFLFNLFMTAFLIGSAGSIIVGNELGADRFEEAKETGKILTKAGIICGMFLLSCGKIC